MIWWENMILSYHFNKDAAFVPSKIVHNKSHTPTKTAPQSISKRVYILIWSNAKLKLNRLFPSHTSIFHAMNSYDRYQATLSRKTTYKYAWSDFGQTFDNTRISSQKVDQTLSRIKETGILTRVPEFGKRLLMVSPKSWALEEFRPRNLKFR